MRLQTWLRLQWDRATSVALVVIAAIVLLVGWLGVSRSLYPAEQIPYVVSAGVGGMLLAGVAAVLWLSADLRDEWRKLDRIEEAIRSRPFEASVIDPLGPLAPSHESAAEEALGISDAPLPGRAAGGAHDVAAAAGGL